jgi:hypothetical protein
MLKNDRIMKEIMNWPFSLVSTAIHKIRFGKEYESFTAISKGAFEISGIVEMDDRLVEGFPLRTHSFEVRAIQCCLLPSSLFRHASCHQESGSRPTTESSVDHASFPMRFLFRCSELSVHDRRKEILGRENSCVSVGQTNGGLIYERMISKRLRTCYSILRELSKGENLDLGSLRSHNNDHLFGSEKSKMRFFETKELFLICRQKVLPSQSLRNEFEIQFSLFRRANDSGVKLPDKKNSPITMELRMAMTPARKVFLLHYRRDGFHIQSPDSRRYFHRRTISGMVMGSLRRLTVSLPR